MIITVKDRVRQINIYNTKIPFYQPHTDPYKDLGSTSFNWAPHLDRILTETRQRDS